MKALPHAHGLVISSWHNWYGDQSLSDSMVQQTEFEVHHAQCCFPLIVKIVLRLTVVIIFWNIG